MNKQIVTLILNLTLLSGFTVAEKALSGPADPAINAELRVSFFANARPSISNLVVETEREIGQNLVFVALRDDDPVAARCIYDTTEKEPRIFLRKGWMDVEVAHEVMHTRMDLIDGFSMLAWRRNVERTDAVEAAFARIQTYVKDEVVHARLIKLGLQPGGDVLRPPLFESLYKNATRYLEEDRDRPNDGMAHLDSLGNGPLCRVCFLVQAELILENYRDRLLPAHVELAEKFIRAFRAHRQEESTKADAVLELFHTYDVQTVEGQDAILTAWIKMEGLEKFVGCSRYMRKQKTYYTLPFPE